MDDNVTVMDVLADILVRLQPNDRRRLRLVSRLWRDVVDERAAADMQSRSKILVVTAEGITYVVDVLSPGTPPERMWQSQRVTPAYLRPMTMSVVGTCNGLICVCDDQLPGGAITLANPTTQEELRLPPLPMASASVRLYQTGNRTWHQTYCFARHPTTGKYKVVHVPCRSDPFWEAGVVHVFTVGEAWWQNVQLAAPDLARCSLSSSSLVDVDGTVYWITEDTRRVVAFDLKGELITRTEPLPVPVNPASCRLTKVHARLGVAVSNHDSVTVWVLEGESWSCRYALEAHKLRKQQLVVPHFAHGDYVLRHGSSGEGSILYRHKMSGAPRSQGGIGVVEIKCKDRGEEVASLPKPIYRIFAYAQTKEPLGVYNVA